MRSKYELIKLLPGLATKNNIKEEMLRVDHAGELGAVEIYNGQAAILQSSSNSRDSYYSILEMKEGEEVHFDYFQKLLPDRNIRPSILYPFWKSGGYSLGAFTALLSKEHAMNCTEAVETVIGGHYNNQISYFNDDDEVKTLRKFRDEELDHLNHAVQDGAHEASAYGFVNNIIQKICKLSIKIASKI